MSFLKKAKTKEKDDTIDKHSVPDTRVELPTLVPNELQEAVLNLKAVIEKHMGAVETTDLSGAWKRLEDLVVPKNAEDPNV